MKLWEIERRLLACTPGAVPSPTPLASPLPSPGGEEICGNPIIIEAGESSVIVPLNFVMEAMITKLIVRRSYPLSPLGDPAISFAVDLFNQEVTEENLETLGAIARVIPQQRTVIDRTMELFSGTAGGSGWSFYNMNGSPTVQSRVIWVRIALFDNVQTGGCDDPLVLVTLPGLTTFDLSLCGRMTGQGSS